MSVQPRNPFRLAGSVGRSGENRRDDVIKAQLVLAEAGDYRLPEPGIPTGWPGGELERAVIRAQKRLGLQPDGVLLPLADGAVGADGGGETLAALQAEVGDALGGRPAPTPDEVDRFYEEHARRGDDDDDDAPPGTVLSDEPAATPPHWRPGSLLAQVVLPPPRPMVPPAAGAAPATPYPHEAPDIQAAAWEVQKRFGYARDNLEALGTGLLRLHEDGRRQRPEPDGAEQAAFATLPGDGPVRPYRPLDEAERKAMQTPPLVPPDIDTRLQGRPAEAPDLPDEKLIPPEIRPWFEELEPFDQELARQLMIVFNSLGNEWTQKGNNYIIREVFDVLEQFPRLKIWMTHKYGATLNGRGAEKRKEQYLPYVDENGKKHRTGSGRPDIGFLFARHLAIMLNFNSATQNRDGSWTIEEINQAEKHGVLSKGRSSVMLEKLRENESEQDYRRKVRPRIVDAVRQFEADIAATGEFEKPDPEVPAVYRLWWNQGIP